MRAATLSDVRTEGAGIDWFVLSKKMAFSLACPGEWMRPAMPPKNNCFPLANAMAMPTGRVQKACGSTFSAHAYLLYTQVRSFQALFLRPQWAGSVFLGCSAGHGEGIFLMASQ